MSRKNVEIERLVIIGNWAKSCETREQLDIVDNFFHKYMKTIEPFEKWEMSDFHEVMFHCGIIDGIILSIRKLKF